MKTIHFVNSTYSTTWCILSQIKYDVTIHDNIGYTGIIFNSGLQDHKINTITLCGNDKSSKVILCDDEESRISILQVSATDDGTKVSQDKNDYLFTANQKTCFGKNACYLTHYNPKFKTETFTITIEYICLPGMYQSDDQPQSNVVVVI